MTRAAPTAAPAAVATSASASGITIDMDDEVAAHAQQEAILPVGNSNRNSSSSIVTHSMLSIVAFCFAGFSPGSEQLQQQQQPQLVTSAVPVVVACVLAAINRH